MRYFSLFSGIGGFELGIEMAQNQTGWEGRNTGQPNCRSGGEPVSDGPIGRPENSVGVGPTDNFLYEKQGRKENQLPSGEGEDCQCAKGIVGKPTAVCVGYSEIDRWADAIYRYHFPDHQNYGDATKIVPHELPDFDFLVAGFPCQAFSIAGKRRGFQETRGTLFFEIARILADKRPRYFFLENVKGLLSHEHGKTFQTILKVLSDIGYLLQWEVLNSKNYGVPQNRERVFIIGHLRGERRPEVFPVGEGNQKNIGDDGRNPTAYAIDSGCGKGCNRPGKTNTRTMIIQKQSCSGIRRLTPRECERLQGFPDDWTAKGIDDNGNEIKISDTQRYKCLGNAVTVNVISEIFKRWNTTDGEGG